MIRQHNSSDEARSMNQTAFLYGNKRSKKKQFETEMTTCALEECKGADEEEMFDVRDDTQSTRV